MSNDFNHDFFKTTSVTDFKNPMSLEVPDGYPTSQPEDEYSRTCFNEDYEKRKAAFIQFALDSPSTNTTKGFFYELIRLKKNSSPINENALYGALDYINSRRDCSDFMMTGILRLYYQFKDHEFLSSEFLEACKNAILSFKYWPDEPGTDSMCYWTENHHILFSTCEYLAGQLFPEEVFTNSGHRGLEKMQRARKRILKWMELRFYTGFSEWLSNVYFDESMPPLINLYDLAEDKLIKKQSKTIIDLMLYDMALNSYYGIFSCTHGRTYTLEKTQPLMEDTIDTAKLMFGLGKFTNKNNMAAALFSLSMYKIPEVIFNIANSTETLENKQRVSIRFKDAKKWGYGKLNLESALGLLSFGGYSHYRTFNHLALMLERFGWWDNKFFLELQPYKKLIQIGRFIGLTNLVGYIFRKDMSRNSMTEANICTYKTRDYMLSTAQNYRKGNGGDQHHIWQATLDNQAVVFTTHPGGFGESAPDAYWHGNGFMPKSLQFKQLNITIYNTPSLPTLVIREILDFTHAFIPKERFDELREQDGWIFGRSGNGYLAIYSMNEYKWTVEGDWKDSEIIAAGKKNIYITELGNKDSFGSFDNFINRISRAQLRFRGLNVEYHSPSLGLVTAGWNKKFKAGRRIIPTENYLRYENSSSVSNFEAPEIDITFQKRSLKMRLD